MNFQKMQVKYDDYHKFSERVKYNYQIADYYLQLYQETGNETYLNLSQHVELCCTTWDLDYYRLQAVKDIKHVLTCKNKFCPNCQNTIALKRYNKFAPVLEKLSENYNIYHVVLTVENCSADNLESTLNLMTKSFLYINHYFLGKRKVRGINFSKYGYAGAVKSLEITHNIEKDTYHPHFHCLFLFDKKFNDSYMSDKTIVNDFSYSRNSDNVTYFSEFEILIQKIWRLLNNKVVVNYSNIESLPLGYSCIANKAFPTDYKEVFKYALKNDFKDGVMMTYESFKLYLKVLNRRRVIQGHGILYNYDFTLENEELQRADFDYLNVIDKLNEIETPLQETMHLNSLLYDMSIKSNITFISRKSILDYLKNKEDEND